MSTERLRHAGGLPVSAHAPTTPLAVAALKGVAWLLLAAWFVHAFTAGQDDIRRPIRPPVADSPGAVMAEHDVDCWRAGEAALTDEIPGSVIIQRPNGYTLRSKAAVGPALDKIFGNGDASFTVIAFCR